MNTRFPIASRFYNALMLAACITVTQRSSFAQDACDSQSVIQPAIEEAAATAKCNADGVYVSASSFVAQASERCSDVSDGRCRKCFKFEGGRAVVLARMLARSGVVETDLVDAVRDAFAEAADAQCTEGSGPRPTPTGDDDEDQGGDRRKRRRGGQEEDDGDSRDGRNRKPRGGQEEDDDDDGDRRDDRDRKPRGGEEDDDRRPPSSPTPSDESSSAYTVQSTPRQGDYGGQVTPPPLPSTRPTFVPTLRVTPTGGDEGRRPTPRPSPTARPTYVPTLRVTPKPGDNDRRPTPSPRPTVRPTVAPTLRVTPTGGDDSRRPATPTPPTRPSPVASPLPTRVPTLVPSVVPSPRPEGELARAVMANCPCPSFTSQEAFLTCANGVIAYAVEKGLVTTEQANLFRQEVANVKCGAV